LAALTVLKFSSADGAGVALDKVKSLHMLRLIQLIDAAIVTWPNKDRRPRTKQLVSLSGTGVLQGAFWGMLFGLIFFNPFFELAADVNAGGLCDAFDCFGIDNDFIQQTQAKITIGTSALFLLTSGAVVDIIADEFKGQNLEIIATNISNEQEQALKFAFSYGEE
jgi:uncharacterized membrane protein